MNIDALLDSAKPSDALTMRERAELDRLLDAAQPAARRFGRRRLVAGIAAATVLLVAGGAAATAAAGIWHPTWYDAASDWSTDVKTVSLKFSIDEKRYECSVPISLSSTYNGKGIPEFQKALAYLQSSHPENVKPAASMIDDLTNSTWVGQGTPPPSPSKPWVYEQAWMMSVNNNLGSYLSSIGLNPQRVSLSMDSKCDFTR